MVLQSPWGKRTQHFLFNCTDQTIPDSKGFYLGTSLTFRFSSTLFSSLISGERQTACSFCAQISLTDWACAVLVLIVCLKAARLFPQSEQPWTIRGADTFICRPPSLAGIHNPSVMTANYTRRLLPVAFKWLYDHFSEASLSVRNDVLASCARVWPLDCLCKMWLFATVSALTAQTAAVAGCQHWPTLPLGPLSE